MKTSAIGMFILYFLLFVTPGCLYVLPTFVNPEIGYYQGDDTGVSFSVIEENGIKFVLHRGRKCAIIAGKFYRQWGEQGGTHCPTDAYTISGHFTSPTEASGLFRTGYDCSYDWWEGFDVSTEIEEESITESEDAVEFENTTKTKREIIE